MPHKQLAQGNDKGLYFGGLHVCFMPSLSDQASLVHAADALLRAGNPAWPSSYSNIDTTLVTSIKIGVIKRRLACGLCVGMTCLILETVPKSYTCHATQTQSNVCIA